MAPSRLMFLLIRSRWRLSPFSTNSPDVCRSVANNAAAESVSGTAHFASFRFKWNGEVQSPRWSLRILAKKFFSGLGVAVGFDCEDGCAGTFAGAVCARLLLEKIR